jgi:hypothetical protein
MSKKKHPINSTYMTMNFLMLTGGAPCFAARDERFPFVFIVLARKLH